MTIHVRFLWLAGLTTCLFVISSCAQPVAVPEKSAIPAKNRSGERIGELGDPVPPLTVLEWVKGKPVKIQPGTNFYVVVFCTLSQANEFALTSLSSLQKQYQNKGLITVAISEESPEQLKQFVQLKGADIDFGVAADDLAGRTTKNYLHAFGQIQVPRAFVVSKDGKLLWHGHPLNQGMGEVVDAIASGKYNLEQTQKRVVAREQVEQYLFLARKQDARAGRFGRMLLDMRTNDAPGLCDLASKIATDPGLAKRDVELANAALDRAAQLSTTNATDITLDRAILLFQTGKPEAGLAQARQALLTAQGQEAKDEVQICIRAMEASLAASKTTPAGTPTNSPAGKP